MIFPAFVIDTSAAAALFLNEQEGVRIQEMINELLSGNGQIFIPPLFWYEFGNTLVTALRRGKISPDHLQGIEADIGELPFVADSVPDEAVRMRIREIAVQNGLTYYDASYIELARRHRVKLVSFDRKLLDASNRVE